MTMPAVEMVAGAALERSAPWWRRRLGRAGWRQPLLANSTVRREAKSLLYAELALAVRRRVPLAEALAFAGSTQATFGRAGTRSPGIDWLTLVMGVLLVPVFVFSILGAMGLLMLMLAGTWFQCAGVVRVARLMALRLHHKAAAGLPLAAAMAAYPADFSAEERSRFAVAEDKGILAETLEEAAAEQKQLRRVTEASGSLAHVAYIFALAVLTIGSFLAFVMLPKLSNIMAQVDVAPPAALEWFRSVSELLLLQGPLSVAFVVVVTTLVGLGLTRALLNGSATIRTILLLSLFFVPVAAWIVSMGASDEFFKEMEPEKTPRSLIAGTLSLTIVGILPAAFILQPLVFLNTLLFPGMPIVRGLADLGAAIFAVWVLYYQADFFLRMSERVGGTVAGAIPGLAAVRRALAQARLLSGLAASVRAGMTAPEALRFAALGLPRAMRGRVAEAERLTSQGTALGEALRRCRALPAAAGAEVALAEKSPEFAGALRSIAQFHGRAASEKLERWVRVAEAAGLLLLGGLVLGVLVAFHSSLWHVYATLMQMDL